MGYQYSARMLVPHLCMCLSEACARAYAGAAEARVRMEVVMNDTKKVSFTFNTAISAVDGETGKWDEKAHNQLVMPLRALIMGRLDGATGCHISRYDVEVSFLVNVTDTATVVERVQNAVDEASGMPGFFPLKGDKTPAASYVEPAKPNYDNHWWVARVTFNTDLFINEDEVLTQALIDRLVARLVRADGARQPGVDQRKVYIRFDQRQVAPARMKAHLEQVISEIMEERAEKGYFPFADPTFTYEEYVTPYLI